MQVRSSRVGGDGVGCRLLQHSLCAVPAYAALPSPPLPPCTCCHARCPAAAHHATVGLGDEVVGALDGAQAQRNQRVPARGWGAGGVGRGGCGRVWAWMGGGGRRVRGLHAACASQPPWVWLPPLSAIDECTRPPSCEPHQFSASSCSSKARRTTGWVPLAKPRRCMMVVRCEAGSNQAGNVCVHLGGGGGLSAPHTVGCEHVGVQQRMRRPVPRARGAAAVRPPGRA